MSAVHIKYLTSRGRSFNFDGWEPGETPLELFDSQQWLKCLHACMFMTSRQEVYEDDQILHELVHLALGIAICVHNTMGELREDIATLTTNFHHQIQTE